MSSQSSKLQWLGEQLVIAIHEAQIAEHGGSAGIRDPGLLSSALARPKNARSHTSEDVPRLSALYALGIVNNHPFVDGNKRVAAVLLEVFLERNGYELTASDEQLVEAVIGVASGELSERAFASWMARLARRRQ